MIETARDPRSPVFRSGLESVRNSWRVSGPGPGFIERILAAAESDGAVLQRTRHKEVIRITLAEGDFVLKRYTEKRFFRYFFRPSLALRELRGYRVAAELKLPAAEVVACGDEREGVRLKRAFIVTGFVEGGRAGELFHADREFGNAAAIRDAFLRENIARLARLHQGGYLHGGAHPRNFLWSGDTPETLKLVWIDLATMRKQRFGVPLRDGEREIAFFLSEFKLPEPGREALFAFYRERRNQPAAAGEVCHEA